MSRNEIERIEDGREKVTRPKPKRKHIAVDEFTHRTLKRAVDRRRRMGRSVTIGALVSEIAGGAK